MPYRDDNDWAIASRQLRETAAELVRTYPRLASVALMLSDALTFTPPEIAATARPDALRLGLLLLLEPFVPEESERRLFRALVADGWQVSAFADGPQFEQPT